MPVFHTKTIESILEPVAQQVSKLVILHEEAEDGNAMPDLARPVQAVKLAVDNLVKVGYDTINNSEDQILKQDMPPALNRVEEASILLLQASDMLRGDPYSAPARKKLIEGSRGILQGTSALLLAFDESEVRKIIRICKNVLEYLAITEVVDTMEDLVTFVKNLSPVLTKMTKEVDVREKELTHQVHREWLQRSLENVKQLTPLLISGIKNYVTTKSGGQGVDNAVQNRNYVIHKMCNEIHEIIRVLQLTTYDEEEWDADDITVMKKAQNAIEGKLKQGQDWLADTQALPGSSGERVLRSILDDALKIADRCVNPDERDAIHRAVSDIQSMLDALCELRAEGKGDSPQAIALARGIQQKLHELADKCGRAVTSAERSGVMKPAHTVDGKVDQAQRWLANPGLDDKGLGERATREVVGEARRVAGGLEGPKKAELLRLCDEVESLNNQLADLCRRGLGDSPQARAIAANLSHKLNQLKNKLQDALVDQVADDFIDISTPLKQLSDAAMTPYGTPNREQNFEDKARNFAAHSNKLSDTAKMVAAGGGCNNKRTVEGIQAHAQQVDDLAPQVVKAAKVVLLNPNNPASLEHFDLLKKQWTDNMEKLRGLVDEATDTASFIKALEEGILRDTDRTEQAIRNGDPAGVVNNTSNIARRSNRVLQVAQQEADNSEDPEFVNRVNNSIGDLKRTIAPMVQNAKGVAQNPRDQAAGGRWRGANRQLIDAVGGIRDAVTVHPKEPFPPPPDLSALHISAKDLWSPSASPPQRDSGGPRTTQPRRAVEPGGLGTSSDPDLDELFGESPARFRTEEQGLTSAGSPPRAPQLAGRGPEADEKFGGKRVHFKQPDPSEQSLDRSHFPENQALDRSHFPENQALDRSHFPENQADPYGLANVGSDLARDLDEFYDNHPVHNKSEDVNEQPLGMSHSLQNQTDPYGLGNIGSNFDRDMDELFGNKPVRYKTEAKVEVTPDSSYNTKPLNQVPEVPVLPPELAAYNAPQYGAPPPPVPPPPPEGLYHPYRDQGPPRPPLPRDTVPPRPPPPETDDEDEMNFPTPQANQPIMMAAHALHMDVREYSSRDNELIAAAKRMALLMARLSQLVRGEGGSKKDLIACAKAIAEASEEVTRLAKELARECTDKRMRTNLLQVCERIPTIGTQLKILSTVKATMLGAQGSDEDQEATEMLVGNAQNLMQSVRETVRAAEGASIKIRVDSGYSIRWTRKRPWYT